MLWLLRMTLECLPEVLIQNTVRVRLRGLKTVGLGEDLVEVGPARCAACLYEMDIFGIPKLRMAPERRGLALAAPLRATELRVGS
jgi:hypothetical protein